MSQKGTLTPLSVRTAVRCGLIGLALRLVTQYELPPSLADIDGSNNRNIISLKFHSVIRPIKSMLHFVPFRVWVSGVNDTNATGIW